MRKKNMISSIIVNDTITVTFIKEGGKTYNVDKNTELGKKVISFLNDENYDELENVLNIEWRMKNYTNSEFEIKCGCVLKDGEEVHTYIANKIIEFMENGIPYKYLLNFYNRIRLNPTKESADDMFRFLEHNRFTITPDGYIIAYKKVRHDFKDLYSGTFDNSIGAIVEVDRSIVDPDRNKSCSHGLHVAAFQYAKEFYGSYNGILIEVKLDPKDIVSVPLDYNNQKCRCCKYEVLRVCEKDNDEYLDIIDLSSEETEEKYDSYMLNDVDEDDYYDSFDDDNYDSEDDVSDYEDYDYDSEDDVSDDEDESVSDEEHSSSCDYFFPQSNDLNNDLRQTQKFGIVRCKDIYNRIRSVKIGNNDYDVYRPVIISDSDDCFTKHEKYFFEYLTTHYGKNFVRRKRTKWPVGIVKTLNDMYSDIKYVFRFYNEEKYMYFVALKNYKNFYIFKQK